MTPTEKARRSDALYFDTKVTNRRALCDMIANLEGDIEELRARVQLPYWWTHDGTLHIDSTRMPTRIVVNEGGTCEFVPKRDLQTAYMALEQAQMVKVVDG